MLRAPTFCAPRTQGPPTRAFLGQSRDVAGCGAHRTYLSEDAAIEGGRWVGPFADPRFASAIPSAPGRPCSTTSRVNGHRQADGALPDRVQSGDFTLGRRILGAYPGP